jgi:prevent-host-death family protein
MRRISHREFRNNSAAVLREVQAGETMEITNNGEVVAVLSPPSESRFAGMKVRRATQPLPPPITTVDFLNMRNEARQEELEL